jgi:hypothetical protein
MPTHGTYSFVRRPATAFCSRLHDPMPLHQADILLYRARLFSDRPALARARKLIEKHGYHRRDKELRDAESALGSA